MGSEKYKLKWSKYESNILAVFSALLENETLSDVTLFCEGIVYKILSPSLVQLAPSYVLISVIEVLTFNFSETDLPIVIIFVAAIACFCIRKIIILLLTVNFSFIRPHFHFILPILITVVDSF